MSVRPDAGANASEQGGGGSHFGIVARIRVRTKLMVLMVGICLVALTAACSAFVMYDRTSYAEAKRVTMEVLADAVAQSAMGAVAFGDAESAAYVLQSIGREATAVSAAVYTQDGKRLAAWIAPGHPSDEAPEQAADLPATTAMGGERLWIRRPIEKDGVRSGELYAAFSTNDIAERTRRFLSIAGLVLAGAVLAAFAAAGMAQGVITRPVQKLVEAASALRSGTDLSLRAEKVSDDELGLLTDAFNEMIAAMQAHEAALERQNQLLEQRVRERTHDLDVRNTEMRLVLDNVDQGFVTLSREGVLLSERSRAFDQFFQVPQVGVKLWEHLELTAPGSGPAFELGWDEVVDGMLPLELSIEQLPTRLKTSAGQELLVEYRPIMEEDTLCKMLVIFTNITAQVARERAAAEQAEIIAMFEAVMNDRHGFKDFFDEADGIVKRVVAEEGALAETLRDLHTLKGNLGISRLHHMAEEVHHIESRCLEAGEMPAEADRELLQGLWTRLRGRVNLFLGERANTIVVDALEYSELEELLVAEQVSPVALLAVQRLRREKVAPRLQRLGQEASRLARRLGRGQLSCQITGGDVRTPEASGWLWSLLPHLVRNAIDHGYRPLDGDERREPELFLRAQEEDDWFVLEVADGGYGIRWERLRAVAEALGEELETEDELVELMFRDRVSTQEEATEVSGRGVGLSAVKAAVEEHGGSIRVTSRPNEGTTFTIRIPLQHGAAATTGAESEVEAEPVAKSA